MISKKDDFFRGMKEKLSLSRLVFFGVNDDDEFIDLFFVLFYNKLFFTSDSAAVLLVDAVIGQD